jgi:hypothetical protein
VRTEMKLTGIISLTALLATCLVISAQAARPEPQLLGDERPILQVCSPFFAFPIQLLFYQRGNVTFHQLMLQSSDSVMPPLVEQVKKCLPFYSSQSYTGKC